MGVSVAAIVFSNDQGSVLLTRRRDVPSLWTLPGGGIDPGETPQEAAVREVKEETGLDVTIARKTGFYTPLNWLSTETHVFACTATSQATSSSNETLDSAFFPLSELPKTFFLVHRDMLEDALNHTETVNKPLWRTSYHRALAYALCHPIQTVRFLLARLGLPLNKKG